MSPRAVRYRLGKTSPEGFFRESYDYIELRRVLLDPLSSGGAGIYTSAVFDVDADQKIQVRWQRSVFTGN